MQKGEWKSDKQNGHGIYTYGKNSKLFGDKYDGINRLCLR
jgi:hypothetical protein